MKKNIIFALLIIVMGVQQIMAQPAMRSTETEDRQGDLKGFIPQFEGKTASGQYLTRRNLSVAEVADYAFDGIRPKINPSNESWYGKKGSYWNLYAEKLKQQIVFGIRLASGKSLTEQQVEEIFRNLKPAPVTGEIKSTGLAVDQSGKPIGTGWTIIRKPYVTRDGLGEQMVVYEGPNGTFKLSLVCGNSFKFEEKPQPPVVIKPEPKPEKVPVFCNEEQKYPVFCNQQATGNSSVIATTVKPEGTSVPQSGARKIETTVPVKQYTTSTGKVLVPAR